MLQVCVSVWSGSVAVNWPVALLAVPPSSCTDATIGPPLITGALLVTVAVTGWVTGPPLWSSTIFGVSGVFVVSVGATVGLMSEGGGVLVGFRTASMLGWFGLVGPVLVGCVSAGGVVVNVIFVEGLLSTGEVLVGAELGPPEPPGAGPLPGPVSPGFGPDGLFGSFRNWFGAVGAVPMPAAVAAAIALSVWNDCPSIDAAHVDRIAGDPVGQGERSGKLLARREIGLQTERRDGVAIDGRYVHGDERAANAQRRGRGIDPHVAGLGDLGGDEAHRPLDQVDQRGVRRAVRIVDELVERHARVLFETERAAVGKTDPERGITAGLDDVALEYEIAHVQVDGDAVARDRRRPAHRFDAPDRLLRGRRGCLSVLTRRGRARKQLDHARGKQSAFRRNEVRLLLVPEIIGDENLVAVVAGQDEVGSFALEVGREQKMRVRNRDGRGVRLDGHRRDVFVRLEGFAGGVNQGVIPSGRAKAGPKDRKHPIGHRGHLAPYIHGFFVPFGVAHCYYSRANALPVVCEVLHTA